MKADLQNRAATLLGRADFIGWESVSRGRASAFTLIELLVVIAIIPQ